MVDILLRGVPEEVVRGLDRRAAQLGISRAELLRRELALASRSRRAATTVADLARCAETFADLADDDVMDAAWS
jgi:hypothetical protein